MFMTSSTPRWSNRATKLLLLFVIFVAIFSLGVSGVIAQSQILSFMGNNFNITPSTNTSSQMASSVAYNPNRDQWLVVWKDDRPTTGVAIYGRRVDKDANLLGSEIVVLYNPDSLDMPSVAFDSTQSRYLVVWENNTNGDIEGKVLTADGALYSADFTIAECVDCSNPDVVYNPVSDEYLVVWKKVNSLTDADIRGRKVGVGGVPDLGGDFEIAAGTNKIFQYPVLAVAGNGKYLVVFSHNTTGNFDIGGQRLNQNGSISGDVIEISDDTGDELTPDVAINPTNNNAFVAWEHDTGTSVIKGRFVLANNDLGGQPTLSTPEGSDEGNPSLSYARTGDPYLVTWDNGVDVFGCWVNATGAIASDIFAVTSSANTQYAPTAAFGTDRFLVAYNEWSGQYDVWGRFGTANGRLYLPIVRK